MKKFATAGYRTREAAEEAAIRWSDVYPEEDMDIKLEGTAYVLYLPYTDEDYAREECRQ